MCEVNVKCTVRYEGATVEQIVPPTAQVIRLNLDGIHDPTKLQKDFLAEAVSQTVLARNDHFGFPKGTIQVHANVESWQPA